MKVSIIIPALNASKTIQACLAACAQQVLPAAVQTEIILVDDGSTDDTAELAQAFDIRLLRHKTARGAAAARNTGIAVAEGEVILFTDADCVPRQNWVAEMIRPFTNPTVIGAKGIYATNQPQLTARFVQIEYEDKYDLLRQQPHIDFIDTYSAAYRAEVLRACGGFDERIRYVEDQDLSFRLAEQGHVMVFQPTAVVSHHHSDSLWRYVRKKFMIGYWKSQIMRRYPRRAVKDSHTPQVLKLQMGLVALTLASLAISPFFPPASLMVLFLLLLFFLSTLPFLGKTWTKDRAVCLAGPFFLWCRALALGLGYAWGMLRPQPGV
jgi:glycosyltransferase involved in cell wall biosynthesis